MTSPRKGYPDVYRVRTLVRPVEAVVRPPGSKSITNRAMIIAALASGVSRVGNPLESEDTVAMRGCLSNLGVAIDDVDDPWLVLGSGGRFSVSDPALDAMASGTTARFITAIAVLADQTVTIDGTARMRERPISDLTDALVQLGVKVATRNGFPPVVVSAGNRVGGKATVDASKSSQFVSALLLAAPAFSHPVELEIRDGVLVSRPYVTTTIEVMSAFGVRVEELEGAFRVSPGGYAKTDFEVESDASAAVYPAVAAAITGGRSVITGLAENSTQADMYAFEALEQMGCQLERKGATTEVRGPDRLESIDIDMNRAPDATLGLAVACLFADGPSRIRNVGNLRIKETDRLAALSTELARLGAEVAIEDDDLIIRPGRMQGVRIETYDDHRMAMAFSLVGLRISGVEVLNPGCVAKTWPAFFDSLETW